MCKPESDHGETKKVRDPRRKKKANFARMGARVPASTTIG